MELLPNLKSKLDRYTLGNELAKAGLKESLHRFIKSVICEDEKLTIVFNHNMAKFEFEHSKEQFLELARKYYKTHAKEFEALNFIPNDPALIADLHAIKRKAGAKSFTYDSDRNEHGHADRFWALALALSYFEKVRDKRGKAYIIS